MCVGPHSVTNVRIHVETLPNLTSLATIRSSAKLRNKNIHLTNSQIKIDPQTNDTVLEIRNDSDNIITLNKNMKIITVNNYEDFSSDFPVSQDILPPLTEKDFNLSGLDNKIKNRLFQLLISHKSAFARSTVELSAAVTEHHRISLQHDYPIKCPIYKIPFNLRNEFRRQIADLEKAGIISKSNSQYNTPALFVKQKEKWRLVLDFRKLNEITVTQDFVIPTLDDILHEISGSNYFSALDMKSAFNQIPLHFADRHKTAFSTPDGCCNFYRRYIKNFAKRALPLTNLLRKDTPFEWTSETQEAFDDIKKAILNPPVLALPDQNAELQITTDASSRGIGAVLEQKYPNSEVKPLYFFSKKLNPSQSKYNATVLEFFAIYTALNFFRPFLLGRKFKVFTDHKPLAGFLSNKNPSSKLALEEFNYDIHYIRGSLNSVADHLSRYINNITIALPDSKDLINMQREDSVLSTIIQKIDQNDVSPQISNYFINGEGLLCHLSKRPSRSPRSNTTRKQSHGYSKRHISSYSAHVNGRVEKPNQSLANILASISQNTNDWDDQLPHTMLALNSAIHEATYTSPFFLEHGRDIRLSYTYEKNSDTPQNKPKFEGPYRVIERFSNVNYRVQHVEQLRKRFNTHVNRMIPFIKRFSYLHLKNLDDLQPDETEVKGIVPSSRYNLRARAGNSAR
ncbi:retrovirus-related Pol polyprotein from transposon 412 [Trichonephila clavipes]|nr:retrovirus-related Pol polyprotein from transposon 412 [Trichonephila clavipes]